jgi:hypothetical protein
MNYEAYESHDAETFDPVTDLYWPFTAFGIKASYPTFDIKRMLTPPLLARYKEVTTKGCWYYAYAALKDLGPPRPGTLLPLLTAGCQHQASQPAMRRIGVEAWVPHPSSRVRIGRSSMGRDLPQARQPALTWRAAASAVSSGRVLKAIAAFGAALWMMFTTVSNSAKLFGGILRPPPITTQS